MDELQELLKLQKESSERAARLEMAIEFMKARMDGFDVTLKEMSNVLSEQKHLSTVVDQIAVKLNTVALRVDAVEDEIKDIKNASAKHFYEIFRKIVWIIVPIAIGAFCTFLGVSIKSAIAGLGN